MLAPKKVWACCVWRLEVGPVCILLSNIIPPSSASFCTRLEWRTIRRGQVQTQAAIESFVGPTPPISTTTPKNDSFDPVVGEGEQSDFCFAASDLELDVGSPTHEPDVGSAARETDVGFPAMASRQNKSAQSNDDIDAARQKGTSSNHALLAKLSQYESMFSSLQLLMPQLVDHAQRLPRSGPSETSEKKRGEKAFPKTKRHRPSSANLTETNESESDYESRYRAEQPSPNKKLTRKAYHHVRRQYETSQAELAKAKRKQKKLRKKLRARQFREVEDISSSD